MKFTTLEHNPHLNHINIDFTEKIISFLCLCFKQHILRMQLTHKSEHTCIPHSLISVTKLSHYTAPAECLTMPVVCTQCFKSCL
jgi:hypothetical protein